MSEFNEEQKRAIKYAIDGHNIFLTGPAGVGKSYTVNEIVRLLKKMNKNVSITASTGISADHISGCTLHSWVGCGLAKEKAEILAKSVRRNSKALERWTKTDVLVIDETSMLDYEFVTKINHIAKIVRGSSLPFGGIQMIFVGDFFQLPPVQKDRGGKDPIFLFETDIWNLAVEKQVLLTKVYRQENSEFIDILMQIRNCKMTKDTINKIKATSRHRFEGDIKPTKLSCRNLDVDVVNMRELEKLPGDAIKFKCRDFYENDEAEKKFKKTFQYPEYISLKPGAQIMLLINKPELGLVNGSRGVVVEINNENENEPTVNVKFSNGIITDLNMETREITETRELNNEFNEVIASRCQFPLKLAWCMTIHKSQGQTIELLDVDLKNTFTYAQVYVALSRGVSLENMRIRNFDPVSVRTAPAVIDYYRQIKEDTETIMQKRARLLFEDRHKSTVDKRQKVGDSE